MSFQAMTWATNQLLPVQQKMVLLMLANRTNHDTGMCIPSMKTLAKECGMSRDSVKRAIGALVDAGLLTVEHRRDDGVHLTNQYRLAIPAIEGVGADSPHPVLTAPRGVGADSPHPVLTAPHNLKDLKIKDLDQEQRHTPPATRPALPDWIDPAAWAGFAEMRKRIRSPLTDRAIAVTIRELTALRESGENPNAVLDQSTQRGWRGVFAIKQENSNAASGRHLEHRETPLQRSERQTRNVLERAARGELGPEWDFHTPQPEPF